MHLVAKRRLAAAAVALIAFAALAVSATAGHWPMFGGDSGRSGYQPVDEGGLPVSQRYQKNEPTEQNIQTSPIVTGGAPADAWRLVYGTQQASPVDAFVHLQRLVDGGVVGAAEAGVDIGHDGPVRDADSFTGASGSITPVDTSIAGDPGVILALHNDDDQDGFGELGDGSRDPRTGDDIALAIIDVQTGLLVSDKAIGTNNPREEDTINMTTSSSPVLGPHNNDAQTPTRDLYFLAERALAEVSPDPATGKTCNPDQPSFEEEPYTEQPAPGGPSVTLPPSCNIPAQRKLIKVTISNPTSSTAAIADIDSVEIGAQLNMLASPTLVRLDDPGVTEGPRTRTYVAVGTLDGRVRTYKTADLSPGPISADLGDVVNTPVVPVGSAGQPADPDPPIYVTVNQGTTGFKAFELHRVETPAPGLAILDPTRDQSGVITGTPAPAGAPAVSAAAENVPAGGRFVVTSDKNLYSFDANDLSQVQGFKVNNDLVAGTTGFSRTSPALQNGLVYVQRDNGEQIVADETTLTPVPEFSPFADPNTRAANDGVGQPAIASGFIAFAHRDGPFVYRNENAPTVQIIAPAEGSTLTGTVKLRATAYNMRSGIDRVVFLLNGIAAGEGVLVSGSPTSSSDPGVYELSFDSRTFGNGQYELTARATDADTGLDAPPEARTSAGRGVKILNETPTQLSVSDVEINEGDEGTRAATFTVSKSGPAGTEVTFSTQDGSATAGSDYDATRTVLAFAPGDKDKTVTVGIRGDRDHETDETFSVLLSNTTGGAGIADATGLAIIRNDDAAGPGPNDPVVSVSSATIGEGPRGKTRRMTFDVSLSRPVNAPVTVSYATADQSAQAPADYRASTGTVIIAAGQLTQQFTVQVVGDNLVEGNEVFLVNLSNVNGAGLGNATGTGQIVDDEVAPSARRKPSQVTLRLKPKRDRKSPYRFVATGNVIAPAGLSPLAACQGRVAVQVKAGRKTISNRRVQVRSNCTYRSVVTFKDRKRFSRNGKLGFKARFLGNGVMRARASREAVARTR